MADTNDPYGFDVWRPTPVTGVHKGPGGVTTGTSVVAPEYADEVAAATTAATTPATTESAPLSEGFLRSMRSGSPLNTLYGVDTESYLTDDQRKTMRQIQGKFDASLNRRDRELARYGSPQLSSFVEDEALARAIAGAQALNYPEYEPPVANAASGGGNSGGGSAPRGYYTKTPREADEPGQTGAQTNAQWQRILSGLASIAPLLFGKNAYGEFMNKGLLQWAKEKIFGADGAYMSDASFEQLVKSGVMPSDASGQYILNPVTGMPMLANPNMINTDSGGYDIGGGYGDYGPEPEWGYSPPTNVDWGDSGGIGDWWDWGGGDWGGDTGGIGDYWDWGGGDWG